MPDKSPFILVSLEEEKAKNLAQVLSNDTCRRILDALSAGEASETDLARNLGVPLSTIHYNMGLLVKAGLVQVESFHYSDKGKEVNHYALANKYVIIAPKGEAPSLRDRLAKFLPLVPLLAAGGAVAWWVQRLGLRSLATAQAFLGEPLAGADAEAGALAARSAAEAAPEALPAAAPMMAQKAVEAVPSALPPSPGAAPFAMDAAARLPEAAAQAVQGAGQAAGNLTNATNAMAAPTLLPPPLESLAPGPNELAAHAQAILPQAPWWAHPALWFFVGAALVLLALLVIYRKTWWHPPRQL